MSALTILKLTFETLALYDSLLGFVKLFDMVICFYKEKGEEILAN